MSAEQGTYACEPVARRVIGGALAEIGLASAAWSRSGRLACGAIGDGYNSLDIMNTIMPIRKIQSEKTLEYFQRKSLTTKEVVTQITENVNKYWLI